jgi:hypothetical protein
MIAWLAQLCAVLLLCVCSIVRAQDPNEAARDASARELFDQGVTLGEQGDWTAAEDRFRRALSLRSSPVIAYNLASALSECGKLIEASEIVRRVLNDERTEPGLRQAATHLQSMVMPRIGRVQVELTGQEPGDSVILDGRALHAAQLNVEIPADPGSHQLQLERAGKIIDVQTFELKPAGRIEVHLAAPALAATPLVAAEEDEQVASPRSANSAPAREARPSLYTRWWFWTGVVAVVGLGSVVGIAAASGIDRTQPAYHGNLGSVQVEVVK